MEQCEQCSINGPTEAIVTNDGQRCFELRALDAPLDVLEVHFDAVALSCDDAEETRHGRTAAHIAAPERRDRALGEEEQGRGFALGITIDDRAEMAAELALELFVDLHVKISVRS